MDIAEQAPISGFHNSFVQYSVLYSSLVDGNGEAFFTVIRPCNPALLLTHGMESTRPDVISFHSMRRRTLINLGKCSAKPLNCSWFAWMDFLHQRLRISNKIWGKWCVCLHQNRGESGAFEMPKYIVPKAFRELSTSFSPA